MEFFSRTMDVASVVTIMKLLCSDKYRKIYKDSESIRKNNGKITFGNSQYSTKNR